MENPILFRDVAHFYLHCKLQTIDGIEEFVGIRPAGEDKIMSKDNDGAIAYRLPESVKPILRRVESITTLELENFNQINNPGTIGYNATNSVIANAQETLWLCKNNFDLFGLIDSGQAIELKTGAV